MELIKTIFDCVKIYKLNSRLDNRCSMTYVYEDSIEVFEAKKIGLKLPIPVSDISDYDLNAPFLD